MAGFRTVVAGFATDEDGATAIEYGLIAGLIAVGCLLAMGMFGDGLRDMFEFVRGRAGNSMNDAGV